MGDQVITTFDLRMTSPNDCGNYLDMNLGMAKYLAKRYLENTLVDITENHLVYPNQRKRIRSGKDFPMNKIGIIGAMELEVDTLKGKMVLEQTVKKANMEFCAGTLNGTPVVIVRSGVGKVNAAICAQILCDDFQVTHIINTGVAGSLKAEINIGDIVVSTDAGYHDVDATIFGYALGEVPQLGVRFFEADKEM